MKQITYFLPIKSTSLVHYFNSAIILPSNCYANRLDDIQSTFPNSILISSFRWIVNCDCSLEIVLTQDERNKLHQLSKDFFELLYPIPITRIKKVWFLEQRQAKITVWNINEGPGFLPDNLVAINSEPPNFKKPNLNKFQISSSKESNISNSARRYDVILGGLAFINCAADPESFYSKNYFATLSFFNNLIENQSKDALKHQGLQFDDKYHGLFSKSLKSEWTDWLDYIFQKLTVDEVEKIAKNLNIPYENKLGVLQINSIDPSSHLYEIAVSALYGENKNKITDDLVADIVKGKIKPEKAEDVALVYGLNNGYSKLYNRFRVGSKEIRIKFSLTSKLDYYTIESVYQFVFNNRKNNSNFSYLDDWCPVLNTSDLTTKTGYNRILDYTIIASKRHNHQQEEIEMYCDRLFAIWMQSFEFVLPDFVSFDEQKAKTFYEKKLKSRFASILQDVIKIAEASDDPQKSITVSYQGYQQNNDETESGEVVKQQTAINVVENQESIVQEHQSVEIDRNRLLENIVSEPIERLYIREVDETSVNVLESKTVKQLKDIAKSMGLSNYSKETKQELIKSILEFKSMQGDIFVND